MAKPIVAIVGRPNVGKSTLFNRIAGSRIAIVEDKPGVTRDRIYKDAVWLDKEFTLVDTGGIEFRDDKGSMSDLILQQARLAIEEAEVILFVVDARSGLTATDEEVARMLRNTKKPVILVANKVEDFTGNMDVYDFYRLGLGDPIMVSASHGLNVGDLLDEVVKHLPEYAAEEYGDDVIKIAVIGRPNVGKSSIVNALLGEERVIVSDVAGTTRDAIDTYFERGGQRYLLIDTAGMRKKEKLMNLPKGIVCCGH